MKKILLSFFVIFLITSCNNPLKQTNTNTKINSWQITQSWSISSSWEIINQKTDSQVMWIINEYAKVIWQTNPKLSNMEFVLIYDKFKYNLNWIETDFYEVPNMWETIDKIFWDWEFIEDESYANWIFESVQMFKKNDIACKLYHKLNIWNSSVEEVNEEISKNPDKQYSSNIRLVCANINDWKKERYIYKIDELKIWNKVEGMTIKKFNWEDIEMEWNISIIWEVIYVLNDEGGDFFFYSKDIKYNELKDKENNIYWNVLFYWKLDFGSITDKQTRQYLMSWDSVWIKINLKKYTSENQDPVLEIWWYELIEDYYDDRDADNEKFWFDYCDALIKNAFYLSPDLKSYYELMVSLVEKNTKNWVPWLWWFDLEIEKSEDDEVYYVLKEYQVDEVKDDSDRREVATGRYKLYTNTFKAYEYDVASDNYDKEIQLDKEKIDEYKENCL